MSRVILKAGSIVSNQIRDYPMKGVVIEPPYATKGLTDWVWVKWENGLEKNEDVANLTLTGKLFVEFNND